MSNKSQVGGILSIISGGIGIILGIVILINLKYAYFMGIVLTVAIMEILFGLLGIAGGVYSYRASSWKLALTGGIVGIFTFFPTAIAAIIFLFLGKKDFLVSPTEAQ